MAKKIIGIKVLILPISLALVVLAAIVYIQPVFTEMQSQKKVLEENEARLAEVQAQSKKLTQLKASWQTMEERGLISVALPNEEAKEDYLAELYKRLSVSGALLTNFSSVATSPANKPYLCSGVANIASDNIVAGASPLSSGGSVAPDENSNEDGVSKVPTCANEALVDMSVKGNWDQVLSLLKYLSDTNRIANVRKVTLKTGAISDPNAQANPDLLNLDMTLEIFYMPQKESGSRPVLEALVQSNGFNEDVLGKIKNMIFAAYEPPIVSESGERNMFK